MSKRPLRPVWLLLLALTATGAAAELGVQELTLDNGMRFLLLPRPQTSLVAAGWAARAGSAQEAPDATGLSHLIEHLMFQGTRRIARPGEFSFVYTDAGALGLDAGTLQDLTFYFVTVPAEKLELWFWMESDRLSEPSFREIGREKRVIAEERRQRIESTPTGLPDQRIAQAFWGDSPYAWRPLGRAGHLERLSDDAIRSYFQRHYRPDGLTAVLVGRFDPSDARSLAQRYFGRLAAPRSPASATAPSPAAERFRPAGEPRWVTERCDCPPQARALYPTVPFRHPDSYPLQLLAGLMNGRSGRLHRTLVLDRGLAFAARAAQHPLAHAGYFAFRGESRGETPPRELIEAWDEELERLLEQPIPEAELEKVKNSLAADGLRRLEDPAALAKQLLIYDGLGDWREIEEWPRKILAVEAEQIREAARRHLSPERRLVALVERRATTESAEPAVE